MSIYTFTSVIRALNAGLYCWRENWDKNTVVFKQIPAEIGLDIIPKMQSVPDSVKKMAIELGITFKYDNQMALLKNDGKISSWNPTVEDIFAEDWCISSND